MLNDLRWVRRAAVLGAGVMGAQVAAHLANAGIPVRLYELAGEDKARNAAAEQALARLARLKPPPLGDAAVLGLVQPANYQDDLGALADCDLVIEAISERLDWKRDLYRRVAPHLGTTAVFATNTSGLSIDRLAEVLPAPLRPRFCGVHFFNPPRYMHLVELVPHAGTDAAVLDRLEGFLTTALGKGVVRARDTPSFIGNRVGVFAMLAVMHHAERLGLPLDLVDRLTGVGIGRPKSATFRTADVVGLDTFAHVVDTLAETLPEDPWHRYYRLPDWVQTLIAHGALGQKTGAGVYRKQGKTIQVLDPAAGDYRPVHAGLDDAARAALNERDPARKRRLLTEGDSPQLEFLRAIFTDLFHYCAYHLEDIAHSARDVDLALRWGYGWQLGPFESWQAAGWEEVADLVQSAIAEGRSMSEAPLPAWVTDGRSGVHEASGSWSPAAGHPLPPPSHPVYARQAAPPRALGEPEPGPGETVFETEAVRCWHEGDGIAVLGFKTKMHTVDEGVLEGILQAVDTAADGFCGLVLWHAAPFSAGANLKMVLDAMAAGETQTVERVLEKFQRASLALRHAPVPTVLAVQGLVLGGGCEFLLHADRAVAAFESYIGLVEAGVGLIPAGGGSAEMAHRAALAARGGDAFPHLARYFEQVALAKVAGSALEARRFDFLREADPVLMHAGELLHVARSEARALFERGYRPPAPEERIPVAGAPGMATLEARLVNLREGGFISAHDHRVATTLARVMCGGELDPGTPVDRDWLLRLERAAFMELLETPATQARIAHTLKTGKPLRN